EGSRVGMAGKSDLRTGVRPRRDAPPRKASEPSLDAVRGVAVAFGIQLRMPFTIGGLPMRCARWTMSLMMSMMMALAVMAAQAPAAPAGQAGQRAGGPPAAPPMVLSTPAFADGGVIPNRYTQVEKQVSPALNWINAPANTQSFVVHVHDPEVS